jgi:hypothetical protein
MVWCIGAAGAVGRGFAEHHTDVLIDTIETKKNVGFTK